MGSEYYSEQGEPSMDIPEPSGDWEQLNPNYAFTRGIRRKIYERDGGACQISGKRFDEGFLLDAAHVDHDKTSHYYNTVDNGQMEGVREHLFLDHFPRFYCDESFNNWQAVVLLVRRCWRNGYHTEAYYEKQPHALDMDRMDLIVSLERNGFPITDFISPERYEEWKIDDRGEY